MLALGRVTCSLWCACGDGAAASESAGGSCSSAATAGSFNWEDQLEADWTNEYELERAYHEHLAFQWRLEEPGPGCAAQAGAAAGSEEEHRRQAIHEAERRSGAQGSQRQGD